MARLLRYARQKPSCTVLSPLPPLNYSIKDIPGAGSAVTLVSPDDVRSGAIIWQLLNLAIFLCRIVVLLLPRAQ